MEKNMEHKMETGLIHGFIESSTNIMCIYTYIYVYNMYK